VLLCHRTLRRGSFSSPPTASGTLGAAAAAIASIIISSRSITTITIIVTVRMHRLHHGTAAQGNDVVVQLSKH
jgi:hypothetical protein